MGQVENLRAGWQPALFLLPAASVPTRCLVAALPLRGAGNLACSRLSGGSSARNRPRLLAAATSWGAEFVQAVEFPYYHHPRVLWERELVWLKNIGIRTVAFSVGQNPPKTDPRSDLAGFLKILRRLGLRAWIYEVPSDLSPMLAMQLEEHGGPIAFVEGPAQICKHPRRRRRLPGFPPPMPEHCFEAAKRSPAATDRCSGRMWRTR